MTTATGQFAIDYSGVGDVNPYTNANLTQGATNSQVTSGLLVHVSFTNSIYMYNGTMSGAGVATSKVEAHASGGDDGVRLYVLDENNDGFVADIDGTAVIIPYFDNGAQTDVAATATLGSFTADDLFVFTVTKGTPNSFTLTQNGSGVTLSASTYSATLGTIKPGFGLQVNNSGACSIKSIAFDGLAAGGSGNPWYYNLHQ